jgi:hypothetical protein
VPEDRTRIVEQAPDRVVVETVITGAAAGDVYAAISDVSRMAEWSPEGRGVPRDATALSVGSHFGGSNRNGWHRWSTTCTVAVADPAREFAFDVTHSGLAVARWSYALDQQGADVRVRETWTDARGSLMKLLGIIGTGVRDRSGHNARTMSATLDAMRRHLGTS